MATLVSTEYNQEFTKCPIMKSMVISDSHQLHSNYMHYTSELNLYIVSYEYYTVYTYSIHAMYNNNYHYLLITSRDILLSKTTAARNAVALSYHRMRGLCFPAVVFAATKFFLLIACSDNMLLYQIWYYPC